MARRIRTPASPRAEGGGRVRVHVVRVPKLVGSLLLLFVRFWSHA